MIDKEYLTKRLEKNPAVIASQIIDELVLVTILPDTGELEHIYDLNEVAGRIWELIDGRRNTKDILDIIVDEFEVSMGQAEVDLVAFLQSLEQIHAIKTV